MEQKQDSNDLLPPQDSTAQTSKGSENISSEPPPVIPDVSKEKSELLQPEDSSKIISPPKNESFTTDMEVHHPHHVSHKKKWNEYLLEFFMLFLAVFLGFLAENFREHQVEKHRGLDYIESFYEDLKADTARMAMYIGFDDGKLAALNKLNDCYDTILKNQTATAGLLEIIKISAINRPFKITERTLNQLSNAGGFRLLPKPDADSIIAYQNTFNSFQDFQLTAFQQAQDKVRNTFDQLIDFKANVQMFKANGSRIDINFNSNDVTHPLLFLDDPNMLNRYFNELLLYYRVTYNHRQRLFELKESQTRLITYFKNKYHLD